MEEITAKINTKKNSFSKLGDILITIKDPQESKFKVRGLNVTALQRSIINSISAKNERLELRVNELEKEIKEIKNILQNHNLRLDEED